MPWPKGRPRSPETLAKMSEAARRGHAGMTAEQKASGAAKRSAAMKARWAEDPEKARRWQKKAADNIRKARAALTPENRRKAIETRARRQEADRAQLTAPKLAEYWVFRGKRLRHAEAMSLVETGRMP